MLHYDFAVFNVLSFSQIFSILRFENMLQKQSYDDNNSNYSIENIYFYWLLLYIAVVFIASISIYTVSYRYCFSRWFIVTPQFAKMIRIKK